MNIIFGMNNLKVEIICFSQKKIYYLLVFDLRIGCNGYKKLDLNFFLNNFVLKVILIK